MINSRKIVGWCYETCDVCGGTISEGQCLNFKRKMKKQKEKDEK